MDDVTINMLHTLRDMYPFEVVISSAWATSYTLKQILTLFQWNGLELPIHPDWMTPRRFTSHRAREITGWLNSHPEVDGYIILDDVDSGEGLAHWVGEGILDSDTTFILNPEVGITSNDFNRLRTIVTSWQNT